MRRNSLLAGMVLASAASVGAVAIAREAERMIEPDPRPDGKRAVVVSTRRYGTSKYMPHQGPREVARRLRQQARLAERPA